MGKRSAVEIAVEKIDSEIADLQRVRGRLVEAMDAKPKRARKPKDLPNTAAKMDKA
jgi:hypothetical protein